LGGWWFGLQVSWLVDGPEVIWVIQIWANLLRIAQACFIQQGMFNRTALSSSALAVNRNVDNEKSRLLP
jgi:hypothetical protein